MENYAVPESSAAPFSKGQKIYISVVAFFAWMFSVYDYILFGILLPVIAANFHMSTSSTAALATWVALGTFFVSLTVGPITDYFGRRNALVLTTAGAALSSGLTGLTMSPLYLILVRAISGLGYSEQAVNTTYLSEVFGSEKRGLSYSFIQGGWPVGVLFAALTTGVLLPVVGWRGVFFVATIPALIIIVLRMRLKESHRFKNLQHARRIDPRTVDNAHKYQQELGVDVLKAKKFTIWQLFDRDTRKHVIFLSLAFILNWFGVQVFIVFATTILTHAKGISFSNSLFLLVLSNAIGYVGYIVHGYLGDLIGRRETIAGAWIVSGLAYTFLIFAAHGYVPVLVSYTVGLFFQIGAYSALFTYMGESFPTRMRGTGASFVNAMGPIGGILGSLAFYGLLSSGWAMGTASFLAGAVPTILSGLTLLGANRIRPQQALEDIAV